MYTRKQMRIVIVAILSILTISVSNFSAATAGEPQGSYTGFNPGKWSLNGIEIGVDFHPVLKAFPNKWLELKSGNPNSVVFFSAPDGQQTLPRMRVYTTRNGSHLEVQQVDVRITENDPLYGDIRHVVAVMELLLGTAIHFRGKPYDRLWLDRDINRAIRIEQVESVPAAYVIVLSEYKR
jgi:hypothetical protein